MQRIRKYALRIGVVVLFTSFYPLVSGCNRKGDSMSEMKQAEPPKKVFKIEKIASVGELLKALKNIKFDNWKSFEREYPSIVKKAEQILHRCNDPDCRRALFDALKEISSKVSQFDGKPRRAMLYLASSQMEKEFNKGNLLFILCSNETLSNFLEEKSDRLGEESVFEAVFKRAGFRISFEEFLKLCARATLLHMGSGENQDHAFEEFNRLFDNLKNRN